MFLQACVKKSVQRGCTLPPGHLREDPTGQTPLGKHSPRQTHAHPWRHPPDTPQADSHPPDTPQADSPLPGRRPLQRMVRILLECILVFLLVSLSDFFRSSWWMGTEFYIQEVI